MVNEENHIRIHNLKPQWKVFPKQSQRLRAPDYFPVSSGRSKGPPRAGGAGGGSLGHLCAWKSVARQSPHLGCFARAVFRGSDPLVSSHGQSTTRVTAFPFTSVYNALSIGVAILKVGSGALGSCWNSPENFAQGERTAGAGPARNRRRVRGGDSHHRARRGQGGASGMHRPSFSMKRKLCLLSRRGGKEWCRSGRAQAR